MSRPPRLTAHQRERLGILEPKLRRASREGNYIAARELVSEIQSLLRPTGHETRLMQAKNWLYEAAMEAGKLEIAISGLKGVRDRTREGTRVHLESTALLAICHLRKREIDLAEPLISEVLRDERSISSARRRQQFRVRVIARFEEEATLFALQGGERSHLDSEEIQSAAGRMIQELNEDEIYAALGQAVPPEVIAVLIRVHTHAAKQLRASDAKLLAPVRNVTERAAVGRTLGAAARRVLWRALCDPDNDVYKAWCSNGIMGLLDRKLLVSAVVATFAGFRVGAMALAAAVTALVLRLGLDVYCDLNRPDGVMIGRVE